MRTLKRRVKEERINPWLRGEDDRAFRRALYFEIEGIRGKVDL